MTKAKLAVVGLWFMFSGMKSYGATLWEKVSPQDFAFNNAWSMTSGILGIDLTHCEKRLTENPKGFVRDFDVALRPVQLASNGLSDQLSSQDMAMSHDKNSKRRSTKKAKKAKKAFLRWQFEVLREFHNLNHYHGMFLILSSLARELKYNNFDDSFDEKELPEMKEQLEFYFRKFLKFVESRAFEKDWYEAGQRFFPNLQTLRIELEKLSGENFVINENVRKDSAVLICGKLRTLLSYSNF